MLHVTVGSSNPVKVGAARNIFARLFEEAHVTAVEVPSGVSNQPVGEAETTQGAVNRARAALAATPGAQWGVGLEGGVTFRNGQCWMIQYCAVAHADGRVHVAPGVQFLLPPVIGAGVANGGEVGPLFDGLSGIRDIKKKGGAIGFLTHGLVVREEMYTQMVAAALVPFLHPELYQA